MRDLTAELLDEAGNAVISVETEVGILLDEEARDDR